MDQSKSLPVGDTKPKPRMRWFRLMLNLIVLTVVVGAVGLAASLHNQKKLRLVIEGNQLVVEQGNFSRSALNRLSRTLILKKRHTRPFHFETR